MVEHIGETGNLKAEVKRLLMQNEVCTEQYDEKALKALRKFLVDDWQIPKTEIAKRLDLRNERVFSIDPITAKDLDDALSIK